ncbi:MAG: 4Fe-4S binding protein [Syntrophales bacterium]
MNSRDARSFTSSTAGSGPSSARTAAVPLDCDFCGLCVSTCPVGAINDKLYKDRTRCWNLEHEVVPCSHCGLGCRADHQAENGRLRRVISPGPANRGKWGLLCVRGAIRLALV